MQIEININEIEVDEKKMYNAMILCHLHEYLNGIHSLWKKKEIVLFYEVGVTI